MEEEHNHLIELSQEDISISLENPSATFSLLNLTLQYVPYKILSPNPIIFNLQPSEGILDPCDSIEITVKAYIHSSLNFQSFEKNNKLTILCHENSDIEWNSLQIEQIQRHDLSIKIDQCVNPHKSIEDNVLIAQIYNQFTFSEDEKRTIIDHIMIKHGKTTKYNISNTMMMFYYPKQAIKGDIHLIQTQQGYIILRTYTPAMYINTLPKYPTEPMSPQYIKPKKQKVEEQKVSKSTIILRKNKQQPLQQLSQSTSAVIQSQPIQQVQQEQQQEKQQEKQEEKQQEKQQEKQEENVIAQQSSITNSDQQVYQDIITQLTQQQPVVTQFQNESPKKPLRPYQSEIIPTKDLEQFKQQYQKPKRKLQIKQNFNLAPIELEKNMEVKKSNSELIAPKFKQMSKFNTYSKISFVVLFKDHSYLLTGSDKEVITVWNLSLNSEEGKIRDHNEMKKHRLLQVYEWIDPQERRFATLATDHLIRIFSLEEMRLKLIFKIDDYSEITSIVFLPDKEQVCVAGTPLKTFNLFGSKLPKHRFFRIFNVHSLKEILSEKIPAQDGQILQPIEYTDNENMKHSRLNNILVVNKGYRDKEGGELLFFMIDMNDRCTKILTLTFEQIQIFSVKSLHYLPTRGSFVVVEKNKSNSYQQNKIFVINVKQLQTDDGLKNGIVYKQFEESSVLDDEIYVLPKQEFILKVKGDVVQLIDLKTELQASLTITQQMGENPQNFVQSGQIIRIDGETLQILEMLV